MNPKEASHSQMLSFTNTSNIPVQILGAAACTNLSLKPATTVCRIHCWQLARLRVCKW